jgi:hypothetical protein
VKNIDRLTPAALLSYRGWPTGWLWAVTATSVALAFTARFDVLSYEFAVVIGIVAGLAAGHVGICAVAKARADRSRSDAVGLTGSALAACAPLLVGPLVVISLNATRVPNCDWGLGLAFYAAIPCVSVVYGACAGVFLGLLASTSRRSLLLWIGWVFACVALVVYAMLAHPAMCAYHSLAGYVRAALYDDDARITGTLLVARAFTLLLAGGFLSLAQATHDSERQRLRVPDMWSRGGRVRERAVAVALLVLALGVWQWRGALGLRPNRADLQAALGASRETAHFVIYYDASSAAARNIDLIADDHEFRYAQVREFFGFHVGRKIGSYVYPDAGTKQRLMGAKDAHMADPFNREMHLNYRDFPHASLKHEIAHVFTGELHPLMKVSRAPGLVEGVAVAAAWDEGRLTAHQWAKAMRELDMLPDVTDLMSLRGFWRTSAARSYVTSGSFVRWLRDVHGAEALATTYPFGRFEAHYGSSLVALRDEWLTFLDGVALSDGDKEEARRRFARGSVFQRDCAHTLANIEDQAWASYYSGDYAGARRGFERVAAIEPANARARWRVVQMRMAEGDWEAAREAASAMLADTRLDSTYSDQARETVADAAWRAGLLEDASSAFSRLAAAAHDPSDKRRVGVKLAALALSPEHQTQVQAYFEWQTPRLRLYRLRELTAGSPDWPLGHYLLGRALSAAEAWEESVASLSRGEEIGLPSAEFARESRLARGKALYRAGSPGPAAEAFRAVADDTPWQGERDTARDWIERCQWAATRPSS